MFYHEARKLAGAYIVRPGENGPLTIKLEPSGTLTGRLAGPDPLRERSTLLWHNHFATANQKVQDLAAMRRQNDMFRKYALAPFGELLGAAVRDPALLTWLDAPAMTLEHLEDLVLNLAADPRLTMRATTRTVLSLAIMRICSASSHGRGDRSRRISRPRAWLTAW